MLRQRNDVFTAIAERWHANGHHAQAIEQIFAHAPRLDVGEQIAIGRRDNSNVDVGDRRSADATHFTLLQHAQQLRLHLGRDITDFVEENGAAIGNRGP